MAVESQKVGSALEPLEVKVGKRFQVVIPPALRKKMRLKEGDKLLLSLNSRGIMNAEKMISLPVSHLVRENSRLRSDILRAFESLDADDFIDDDALDETLKGK